MGAERFTLMCQTHRHPLMGTAFIAGAGIVSMILITLAGLYQISSILVVLILTVGLISGLNPLRNFWPSHSAKNIFTFNRSDKVLLALSVSVLAVSTLYSSARLSYDSTAVYFSDAKITALARHILFFTNDSFVASVYQTAIQFTALMQVFGDQSARLLSWISGLVIIIIGISLGEKTGISRRGKLIYLVLIVTSTAFMDLMGDGKVDLFSSAPAIAAVYWIFIESRESSVNKSLLILGGFLIGLAMAARPFNVFLMGIFTFFFYLQTFLFRRNGKIMNFQRIIQSWFWLGIGIIGPIAYHLFANWIILGNPLAPLTNTLHTNSVDWQWAFDPNQLFAVRILYPFVVTFLNSPQSLGNISPLFIAFVPAVLSRKFKANIRLSKDLQRLLIISSITVLIWIFAYFTVVEIRYVFFLWIILFIPAAEITAVLLESGDTFFRNILYTAIIGLLLFINLRTVYISLGTYSPIDRQGNPQCFDNVFCAYLRTINKEARPGDRVLTLGSYRYYLRTDLFACSTKADEYQKLQELSQVSPDAFWQEIYRQGYKYIAYENDYTTRHLQLKIIPSPENTPEWISLEPLFGKPGDLEIAYKINVTNPPIKVKSTCRKNSSGIWEVQSLTP